MVADLEEHVAMVFHRFLSGEVRGKRLAIYLNDQKVEPWDPFARKEATRRLESRPFRLEGEKGKGDVVVEPFVLPHQSKFSTSEAFNRASGPKKWNLQQGFYIYRADRMIQSGGWCGLRAVDEHKKLSRIAISFNPKLDTEFKINVPKMRVLLPGAIRDDIEKFIAPALKMADDVYRKGKAKEPASQGASPASSGSPPPQPPTVDGRADEQPPLWVEDAGRFVPPPPPPPPPPSPSSGKRRASRVELDIVAGLLIQVALPEEVEAIENAIARARPLTVS
jgi:hypothetical protein